MDDWIFNEVGHEDSYAVRWGAAMVGRFCGTVGGRYGLSVVVWVSGMALLGFLVAGSR